MKNKKLMGLMWILALLPVLLTAFVYQKLPEQIPVHWGIDGTVEYGGKLTIWVVALLSPIMAAGFMGLPKIDPRKKSYERFQRYYDLFCIMMMVFMLVMLLLILSESLNPGKISVGRVVTMLVGLLFLFLGNIMPKVKSNFFMGVRTPWTLTNTNIWNRTNRLGGLLLFMTGLFLLIGGFFLSEQALFWGMMLALLLVTGIPTVMSYLWYHWLPEEDREQK